MADQSHLDNRYFIDEKVYNCPFCNRRHVSYSIFKQVRFDWTGEKGCKCFFAVCHSCGGRSMHLTFKDLRTYHIGLINHEHRWRFEIPEEINTDDFLDSCFFYSVPTSFFVLDARVPKILRDLLTEAEGCLESNFLTGASACARKIVYELGMLSNAEGENYEDRIKSLKNIHSDIEPSFFDTLLTIQELTSTKVHENSFDGWEAKHLRIILASLAEVLHEIYVVPALRADRRNSIIALKDELTGSRENPGEEEA